MSATTLDGMLLRRSAPVLVAVLVIGAILDPLWNWPTYKLPPDVEADTVLASDFESGIMQGCMAATFRLSRKTSDKLHKSGIAALSNAARPGQESPHNRFGAWHETPGDIDIANNGHNAQVTFYGLYAIGGCENERDEDFHSKEISRALAEKGSYYRATSNNEGVIVVAPRQRLAAYYYWG